MTEVKRLTQILVKLELEQAHPSIIADLKAQIEQALAEDKD